MFHCSETRLTESIIKYSEFGKTRNGGVTRLSLSEADIEARKEFCQECSFLGLSVRVDDLGNIYGELEGNRHVKPIIIGSHMDSVERGGNFDGILGVLAAKEVVEAIKEHDIHLKHPLVIMDFTNEEGARFEPAMMSSGILTGQYKKEAMFRTEDKAGTTFLEALSKSGFQGDPRNRLVDGAAYIELHVEQGPVLENEHKEIGIVEGVVGMVCFEFKISGIADHAGTTPMKMRVDPLFFASDFISGLNRQLSNISDDLVYTIGRFNISPNIHTIIPSDVVFTLDIRHKDSKIIDQVETIVENYQKNQQNNSKCHIESKVVWKRDTVHFDPYLDDLIEFSSNEFGYDSKRMYSGAGHDAQFMASVMPTAMIFVPSIQGKSHCEDERTSYDDCVKGANVLLHTVLKVDKKI